MNTSSHNQEDPDNAAPDHPLAELMTSWYELNGAEHVVTELAEEPSPLEFLRFVARNSPFVARGGAREWPAVRKWTVQFLEEKLRDEVVNVAVTPEGNADSPVKHTDGSLVFAKPWEEDQPFPEFLNHVMHQATDPFFPRDAEVRYAQTQNDNLHAEYAPLLALRHLPESIPFARIALDAAPDAANLWIGNARSATALHRDHYENIYVQLRGRKHFVLLPPVCQPCVGETLLRSGVYRRAKGRECERERLELFLQDEADTVPFPTWDPDKPLENATAYSHAARPARVTLEPGDMLYLPAMWYHKVTTQSVDEDGICVAVNYWYDMDFRGPLYPLSALVKSVGDTIKK